MAINCERLDEAMVERILFNLGIDDALPSKDLEGLKRVYKAWCRKVPFDNVRKLIHLASANPAPLPGDDSFDFFRGWLRYGTGGTCWAGSGALHLLLSSLGFTAYRGVATMLVAPNLPPNHGTVVVGFDDERYLVDTSILHDIPMRLDNCRSTRVDHPAWGIDGNFEKDKWHVQWRPLHLPEGCICRIEHVGVSHETFQKYNEATRIWGPFNYSLYTRLNCNNSVEGMAYGNRVSIDSTGEIEQMPIGVDARNRYLERVLGMNRDILEQLPEDQPTPPLLI